MIGRIGELPRSRPPLRVTRPSEESPMNLRLPHSLAAAVTVLALVPAVADAQVRVQYGRITNVQATTVTDDRSRTVGTLVGGGIGLATGSGQSGSNRALRGVGGAAAGRGVANLATRAQAFEYTVLIGGRTRPASASATASRSSRGSSRTSAWWRTAVARRRPPLRPRRLPRRLPPPRPTRSRPPPAIRPRSRCWPRIPTTSSTSPSAACGCCAANRVRMNSARG